MKQACKLHLQPSTLGEQLRRDSAKAVPDPTPSTAPSHTWGPNICAWGSELGGIQQPRLRLWGRGAGHWTWHSVEPCRVRGPLWVWLELGVGVRRAGVGAY